MIEIDEIDPFMELLKERERKKANVTIVLAIVSLIFNLISLFASFPAAINEESFSYSNAKALAINAFWFIANLCVIGYGIDILIKNKVTPGYTKISQDEIKMAQREVDESDAYLVSLSSKKKEVDDEDGDESEEYGSRKRGALKRF